MYVLELMFRFKRNEFNIRSLLVRNSLGLLLIIKLSSRMRDKWAKKRMRRRQRKRRKMKK